MNDGKKLLKTLAKHEALILSTYHHYHNELPMEEQNIKAIEELTKLRLAWQSDDQNGIRLSNVVVNLLNHGLRNDHRRRIDANIGSRLTEIEHLVGQYLSALNRKETDDSQIYWHALEEQVYDLKETLRNTTRELWRKIDSEFGYVHSLESKVQENQHVLERVSRLNNGLELVRFDELSELAGSDIKLRRLLIKMLHKSISDCQLELSDALHRLKNMLFEFRKQQQQGQLIKHFYNSFQKNPLFLSKMQFDLTAPIVNQVKQIKLQGHANLSDDAQENNFVRLIQGLRKKPLDDEQTETSHNPVPYDEEQEPVHIAKTAVEQALDDFFREAYQSQQPISALARYNSIKDHCSSELWLYAIIGRYHNLEGGVREHFKLHFNEATDQLFSGIQWISDVSLEFVS